MPNNNPQLELPPSRREEEFPDLRRSLQDRFRQIQDLFARAFGPRDSDLDMGGFRIIRLNDPLNGMDGVNKRYVERHFHRKSGTAAAATGGGTAAASSGVVGVNVVALGLQGILAIQSDIAMRVSLPAARTVSEILMSVKSAPTGADLVVQLQSQFEDVAASTLATGTITAGTKRVSVPNVSGLSIPANEDLVVNLTGVGLTFPGSDLSVQVRLAAA